MRKNYKQLINEIKFKLQVGILEYDEAKKLAEPIIFEMNLKGKEIAKKFGQKFRPFSFVTLMR